MLYEDVDVCFREHRLLREALVVLMAAARPYLEPSGSYANAAMAQARAALGTSDRQVES
jgi:hypothetical protein